MLIPTNPTPESMRVTLAMLRNVRGMNCGDELHLRMLRHCLGMHLHLPGMLSPLPQRTTGSEQFTDERILELLYEALEDVAGESNEDDQCIYRARQVIATQLGRVPVVAIDRSLLFLQAPPSMV